MAARNLRAAADVAGRYPERAAELGVDEREIAAWREAADAMVVPFDDELGVTAQSEGFTRYRRWDFDATATGGVPAAAALSRTTCSTRARSSSRPTSSSRSTCAATASRPSRSGATSTTTRRSPYATRRCRRRIQAIVAAEVGHLDLAYDYFRETALDRSARPGRQHRRRPAPGRAGRRLAGRGRRVRRPARPRRRPRLRPAPARAARPGCSFRLLYRGRRLRVEIGPSSSLRAARRRAARRCSTTASRSPSHPHRRRPAPAQPLRTVHRSSRPPPDGLLASAAWAPTLPTRG